MTNKEIREGNNLIAEFIGVDINYSETEYRDSKSILRDKIDHFLKTEELKFHSSWDWLMAVVEKINKWHVSIRPFVYGNPESVKLKIQEDRVTIEGMFWPNRDPSIGSWIILKKKKFLYSKFSEIEATWKAVVIFIEWYKKIKNETNN